ncbi:prephenate dehydratase [Parvularcula bermudensis HTCC2503]|uniref:prephenate dehydratase n=1 Tax=Parvularcula bermudensis (strain ATCC BAA-594 / HTCC2503 / KCTC 12087) TaxID=314260 RepID=E0TE39_PARBH|nr:prephenate dehydratase [Parvularcula bermudensis]ADM08860.1 prephenate dehydratase [Parvularcula bermudensis HTCC2503]
MKEKIAFQGEPGAFSEEAARKFLSQYDPLPCSSFAEVFRAVEEGAALEALVPVENAIAGRVDDVYRLLPDMPFVIYAEHFLPVHMQLMTIPGRDENDLRIVRSHPMALGQCAQMIARRGLKAEVAMDTAGAAKALAATREEGVAVIAPEAAAALYDLEIIERNVQDADKNVTRFLRIGAETDAVWPDLLSGPVLTSIVFRVRNIPAALYKALGGFATNGVNLFKLESYQEDASFTATRFQAEFEGHPDEPPVRRALEELGWFSSDLRLLGVFPADPYRSAQSRRS